MKKLFAVILMMLALFSCKENTTTADGEEVSVKTTQEFRFNPLVLSTGVIYEANIRQYSPEGTFNAFTKDIPELRVLGVKVIWLMPIHPISEIKRKAKGDLFVEDIQDLEERKKYLGSYYSVADYGKVNPEFGSLEDFKKLVDTAHENGISVIIDWVPNHTGWDHPWIKEHPEYYTKNSSGEITDPLNEEGEPWGWTDVADLNYENPEMQKAMINEMKYWLTQGIDGFRCDVAHSVPVSFWEKAIPQLREEKDIFMLAEAEMPELMKHDLFDMSYGWENHHLLNRMAKGERKAIGEFTDLMANFPEKWEENDLLMHFVTNHDENSWTGPVKERMGDARQAMLALTYCIPGTPLIYSGQEYDLNHRLKFFEKDSIPKKKGEVWPLLSQLGELKNNTPALHGSIDKAKYIPVTNRNADGVLAFRRENGESEIIYITNLNDKNVTFNLELDGTYTDVMYKEEISFKNVNQLSFAPWEYLILKK